ncbi:Microtubule_binding protein EB1 [Hexamita inflata]|uniref:Microtubule binding protein EB1 n=1 Tax=Hexamita inflata TaxID=28002 RepID=A0AA86R6S5_9EUKA|nr:Microtubule binding protein EB1 [Hexamita inflata]
MSLGGGNSSGCYFVGKVVLLKWLNDFLGEPVAKVEDCASGHHYILCLDALYPGTINMTKAKMNAQLEWERIENLKLVQDCLLKNNIDRVVDVQRLANGKYQDNLEFLQWFKWWFDSVYDYTQPFDARQSKARFGKKHSAAPIVQKNVQTFYTEKPELNREPHRDRETTVVQKSQNAQHQPQVQQHKEVKSGEVEEMRKLAEKRTKESKFYFNKLRAIELMLGEIRDTQAEQVEGMNKAVIEVVERVEEILYAPFKEE